MRAAAICLALALAGCGTPRIPERVEIPVPVPCKVKLPERPVWATESLPADAGIWEQVKALLAEREQAKAYQAKLEAAARACE